MPAKTKSLVGTWEKVSDAPCSHVYPDRIEFKDRGAYLGTPDVPGTFTVWDVGTFEPVSDTEVRISTANDAVVTYRVSVSGDDARFVDPDDCEIRYRRVQS